MRLNKKQKELLTSVKKHEHIAVIVSTGIRGFCNYCHEVYRCPNKNQYDSNMSIKSIQNYIHVFSFEIPIKSIQELINNDLLELKTYKKPTRYWKPKQNFSLWNNKHKRFKRFKSHPMLRYVVTRKARRAL